MEMDDAPGLSSMPLVVLTHIGKYLSPRLLYDVSATCLDLRTGFNSNSIWRRHSQGGLYGQMLEHATSLVEPVFSLPALETLDPLCEHRLSYIRQSRLLHNLRHGEYVHHVIPKPEDGFFLSFGQGQIMYKSDYMFVAVVVYSPTWCTFIYVYDIREEPRLVTTFRASTDERSQHHSRDYDVEGVKLNVVGDRLVILHAEGFQVREINLPSATFPLLFSWWESDTTIKFLDNFVIQVTRREEYISNVWNVDTAEKFNFKSPEDGQHLRIMHLSTDEGLILLSARAEHSGTDVYVYNLHTQQYTFHVHYDYDDSMVPRLGQVGSNHVVLYVPRYSSFLEVTLTVSVYDSQTSTLIVQKALPALNKWDNCLINDCLVICDPKGVVKVLSLSGLDLLYELPYTIGNHRLKVSRGLLDLLFIGDEVWDFNERRKLFRLKYGEFVIVNESSSKIITMYTNGDHFHVYSFW